MHQCCHYSWTFFTDIDFQKSLHQYYCLIIHIYWSLHIIIIHIPHAYCAVDTYMYSSIQDVSRGASIISRSVRIKCQYSVYHLQVSIWGEPERAPPGRLNDCSFCLSLCLARPSFRNYLSASTSTRNLWNCASNKQLHNTAWGGLGTRLNTQYNTLTWQGRWRRG